jgi:cyclopropane fatty-acyl-phospholipid synthase-like methyltransferase
VTVHAFRNEQPAKKNAPLENEAPISGKAGAGIERHLRFHDIGLAERFARGKVPMTALYEAYFDGRVDLIGDIYDFLESRDRYVKYSITPTHIKWLFSNFIPEVTVHTKSQDQRIVREHYDRGNDFFGFFLGEPMVYTAGFYKNGPENTTLDEAQAEKINRVGKKLMLKPGETLLDVGCGWGTLVRNTARDFGVDVTGVTLAHRQTEFGMDRIKKAGVQDRARILCCDYRDIPKKKFNKIVSLEMVEHVGVKNLPNFFEQMYNQLDDDGHFLLQWTGLRRGGNEGVPLIGLRPEDLIWGLFMAKYIFPGADASLPCSEMIKYAERAKFEVFSVENVSQHYAFTLKAWHDNWVSNKEKVLATYGERWYRIWNLFLAWSVRIGYQGNAACYQVVFNKNTNNFDRTAYIKNGAKNLIPGIDA